MAIDPLASKYPGWSPYVYTLDNPLKYTDPTGMAAIEEYNASETEQNYTESDPQTGSATRATRVKRQATTATAEVVTQAVEQGTEAAQNVGNAVVKTAEQLEPVALVASAVLAVAGTGTAAAIVGAGALLMNYVQTIADPTSQNLTNAAVQTGLTVTGASALSYVRVARVGGRMTRAQAVATTVNVATAQVVLGAGVSATLSSPSNPVTSSLRSMLELQH